MSARRGERTEDPAKVSPLPCPCCGHVGEVRSLDTLVSEGRFTWYGHMWYGHRHVQEIFGNHVQEIFGNTTTYTSFARQFLPPHEPTSFPSRRRRHPMRIVGLALAGAAGILTLRVLRIETPPVVVGAVVAYLCVIAALTASGWLERRAERDAERYRGAMRRWETLQYCGECGKVFTMEGNHCFEPRHMREYLDG